MHERADDCFELGGRNSMLCTRAYDCFAFDGGGRVSMGGGRSGDRMYVSIPHPEFGESDFPF